MRFSRLLASGTLFLAGCTSFVAPDAGEAEHDPVIAVTPILGPMTLRGYVTIGHEVRSFTPCDGDVMYWITDRTAGDLAAVYESLASRAYQPVFMVVEGAFGPGLTEGFGADYSGQLIADGVRRAELEGHACDEDLTGIEFRAQGNEPFWSAEITADEIRFTEFGGSAPASWPRATGTHPGRSETIGSWEFHSAATGPQSPTFMAIRRERCRDSMSGAYFSFAAEIQIGDRTFVGCAARGY